MPEEDDPVGPNTPPIFSFIEPVGDNDFLPEEGGDFAIKFKVVDSDPDVIKVDLYFKAKPEGACETGTKITAGYGTSSPAYQWLAPPGKGSIYICLVVNDGNNEPIEMWSPGKITYKKAPAFSFTAPVDDDDFAYTAKVTTTWNDTGGDGVIALYHKSTNTGACSKGTLISDSIKESDGDTFDWNLTTEPSADYYLCARIDNGFHDPIEVHSGLVVVERICNWKTSGTTDFLQASNWSNCILGVPGATDKITIPAGGTQPTISSDYSVRSVGPGPDGGTLTIAAGSKFSLLHTTETIRNDLTVLGATPGCTTCILGLGDGGVVSDDAVLTLGTGLAIEMAPVDPNTTFFTIGNGTSGGTLATTKPASATQSEWPVFRGNGATFSTSGIKFNGSSTKSAVLDVNGMQFNNLGQNIFTFVDNYTITQLDHVAHKSSGAAPAVFLAKQGSIEFQNCEDNKANIADTSWDQLEFSDVGHTNAFSVDYSDCPADAPGITISGSGHGFGESYGDDGGLGLLTWTGGTRNTCTWDTAGPDTDWINTGNWTTCGGGVPDSNDWVVIPAGGNQPILPGATVAVVRAFRGGAGGGAVTVSAGSHLIITDPVFYSSIGFQGDSTTCTTCRVSVTTGTSEIVNASTLTLGQGIKFLMGDDEALYVGSVTPSIGNEGHLVTTGGATPTEWPRIVSYSDTNVGASNVVVSGNAGANSSVTIDGLDLFATLETKSAFDFVDYYDINGFDHVRIGVNSGLAALAPMVNIACNASQTQTAFDVDGDSTWTGIDFDLTLGVGGYNIQTSADCTGANGYGIISVTDGGGAGFGEANDNEQGDDLFTWP